MPVNVCTVNGTLTHFFVLRFSFFHRADKQRGARVIPGLLVCAFELGIDEKCHGPASNLCASIPETELAAMVALRGSSILFKFIESVMSCAFGAARRDVCLLRC